MNGDYYGPITQFGKIFLDYIEENVSQTDKEVIDNKA
jgi:hypothetical protein